MGPPAATPAPASPFGTPATNAFGAPAFGAPPSTSGGFGAFGSAPAATSAFGGGGFATPATAPATGFDAFGPPAAASTAFGGGGGFGRPQAAQWKPENDPYASLWKEEERSEGEMKLWSAEKFSWGMIPLGAPPMSVR